MQKHDDDHFWISLKQALTYAKQVLKSEDWAKLVLRSALADGAISVRAETVLTEFALGETRTLQKRRKREHIAIQSRTDIADLVIDPKYFKREPKGARVTYNWSANRIAWIEPAPTKTFYHKATNRRGVVMGARVVMYDIELERTSVETAVKHKAKSMKISETLSAKPSRSYLTEEKYRVLLRTLYDLAEKGKLDSTYGPFAVRGKKTAFRRVISTLSGGTLGETTIKNCVNKLIDIDASARSRKIDQELTNAT